MSRRLWYRDLCRTHAKLFLTLCLFGALNTASPAASGDAIYAEAENLIAMRKYNEAYNLLNSNLTRLAGDGAFDFLFARAALEAAHPAEALLALERVTAQPPVDNMARLYLGRAYFDLWQWQAAREEFENTWPLLTDPNEKKYALDYLRLIEQRLMRRHGREYSAFLEAGLGGDDNANAAPRIRQFMHFALSDASRQSASPQQFARLQGAVAQPLSSGRILTGYANYAINRYPEAHFVDNTSFGTGAVFADTHERRGHYYTLQAFSTLLGEQFNNLGQSFSYMYRRSVGDSALWDINARMGRIRFADGFALKNSNQTQLGFHGQYQLSQETPITVDFGLLGGQEQAIQADSPYSRNFFNTNVLFTARGAGTEIYLQSGYTYHEFPSKFFGTTRSDRTMDLSMGMNLKLQGAWQLRPSLSTQSNVSSVDLYDYRRTIAGIAIRRDLL